MEVMRTKKAGRRRGSFPPSGRRAPGGRQNTRGGGASGTATAPPPGRVADKEPRGNTTSGFASTPRADQQQNRAGDRGAPARPGPARGAAPSGAPGGRDHQAQPSLRGGGGAAQPSQSHAAGSVGDAGTGNGDGTTGAVFATGGERAEADSAVWLARLFKSQETSHRIIMTEMKALRAHQTTLQSDMRIVKKSKTTMRKRLNDTIVEVARVATATEAMAHKANGTAAAAAASTLPPSSSPVPADPVHIPTKVPWAKGMMKSIRSAYAGMVLHAKSFADMTPSAAAVDDLCARHLQAKFRFPLGLVSAHAMLGRDYLTPCVQTDRQDPETAFARLPLRSLFRRVIPRFNEAFRTAAYDGFVPAAAPILQIGSRQDVQGAKNKLVLSREDAQQCLDNHWLFSNAQGRTTILAAAHSVFERNGQLANFLVDATSTQVQHYRISYELYALVVVSVYVSLRTVAGYPSFSEGGGNMDAAFLKVWAQIMLELDDHLPKHGRVEDNLLITNGNVGGRAISLKASRLEYTARLVAKTSAGPLPPPRPPRTRRKGATVAEESVDNSAGGATAQGDSPGTGSTPGSAVRAAEGDLSSAGAAPLSTAADGRASAAGDAPGGATGAGRTPRESASDGGAVGTTSLADANPPVRDDNTRTDAGDIGEGNTDADDATDEDLDSGESDESADGSDDSDDGGNPE